MRYLNKIKAEAYQKFTLSGNSGQLIDMTLRFMPSQSMWMADFSYLDFDLKGIALNNAPNILRGYKDIIPFGIACNSNDGIDPRYIDDFSLQRCNLYLLTFDEVEQIESGLFA